MLAQKIAGWAKRVLSSTRGNGSSPTSSTTRSRRSGARRATWSRISGVWLPWPGNSTAGAWVSVTKLTHRTLGGPHASSVSSHPPTPRVGGAPARRTIPRERWKLQAEAEVSTARREPGRLWLRDQPDPLGLLDRLGAVAGAELAIQRGRVLLDGVRREEQPLGDLAVGGAAGHGLEHLALAVGERRARGGLVGLEDRHAEPDHPHCAGDVGRGPVLGDEAGGPGGPRGARRDA